MSAAAATAIVESDRPARGAWPTLALLTFVYLLNFLDRSLIYILFSPIKKELHLSDLQLALLGTTSFVIFYTVLGVPFGRLSDRAVRKNLIAAGLLVWSIFSGLTGLARSFETIFLCRLMVGVGEATLGPTALSLLADLFPPRMRATVQAIYSSGIALGGGVAFYLGGYLGQTHGWRSAFLLLGFPGVLVSVLVYLIREPEREGRGAEIPTAASAWRTLATSVPLRFHLAGYALFNLAANSLGIWGALFFVRRHGMTLAQVGALAGILSISAGMPGTVLGGVLADRLRRRGRGGRMFFTACGALACIPLWLVLLYSRNAILLIAASAFLLGAALMWLGPAAADVHEIVGPEMRGLGVAVYFFTVNIVGYGIGPPLIGWLSDRLGAAQDPSRLRDALLVCPAACAFAAVLLLLGSRSMKRTRPASGAEGY